MGGITPGNLFNRRVYSAGVGLARARQFERSRSLTRRNGSLDFVQAVVPARLRY